jgi:hypothetical protein
VTFGIGNFNSNSFSCSADDLLNLRERFLIHTVFPYEATNFMALAEGSQTELPAPGWSPLPGSASSTSKYCYSKKREQGAGPVTVLPEQRKGWSLMIFCARATRGLGRPSLGLMARLGVPVGGRVRKLRAVEDQSGPIPEDRTSKLGRSICNLARRPHVDQCGHTLRWKGERMAECGVLGNH